MTKDLYILEGPGEFQFGVPARNFDAADRPTETDAEYFCRRASEERETAQTTTDARLSAIHLELAERYALLAGGAR